MAYNPHEIFAEIDKRLSERPALHLYELARALKCSHPTIEKAVVIHTSLLFRDYKKRSFWKKEFSF